MQVNNILYEYLRLAEIPVGKTKVPGVKPLQRVFGGPLPFRSLQGVSEEVPAIIPLQLKVFFSCMCLLSIPERGLGDVWGSNLRFVGKADSEALYPMLNSKQILKAQI